MDWDKGNWTGGCKGAWVPRYLKDQAKVRQGSSSGGGADAERRALRGRRKKRGKGKPVGDAPDHVEGKGSSNPDLVVRKRSPNVPGMVSVGKVLGGNKVESVETAASVKASSGRIGLARLEFAAGRSAGIGFSAVLYGDWVDKVWVGKVRGMWLRFLGPEESVHSVWISQAFLGGTAFVDLAELGSLHYRVTRAGKGKVRVI